MTADLTIDTIISTDADDGAANTLDLQLNGITLTVEEAIADNANDPLSVTVTDNEFSFKYSSINWCCQLQLTVLNLLQQLVQP